MTRIGTYGSNQMYLARIGAIQTRVHTSQLQVSTEMKSSNYSGIARDANRLINFENEVARANQFVQQNAVAQTRVKATQVSLTAAEQTMKQFRDRLENFNMLETKNEEQVKGLQAWAWQSMIDLQSYLSNSVNGQYLFAGGRVSTKPVELPATNLSDFQTLYDGNYQTYPTTRPAHMLDLKSQADVTGDLSFDAATGMISAANPNTVGGFLVGSRVTVSGADPSNNQSYTVVANDGQNIKVSRLTTETALAATITYNDGQNSISTSTLGSLTFAPGADTITATGSVAELAVGATFTVSGTTDNNGTYEVVANTGTVITVKSTKIGLTETVTGATLKAESYYRGDSLPIQHRVDEDRSVEVSVLASDPAFEKAFRAMGMIAQGAFGTSGGLENNLQRVSQALYLVKDAIESPAGTNPPFGAELRGDMQKLQGNLGVTQSLINAKDTKHKAFAGFLTTRISEMENVDKMEAVAMLLDDQRALETSYQALAKVREMTLLNFLK